MRQVRAAYANALRRRQPRPGDKWHLDEVFIKINGEQKYLWRAVDQDGNVLDILVQNRRDKAAARRFFRRLMKKTRTVPRVIVTDKLRSYGAAHREVMPSVEHRSHKGLNNRAENSHQPTRQRERAMKGFRSAGGAQRFLSAFSGISPHFRPRRHLMSAHRLPSRDDRPLRHLGADHRRRRPAHHGLSTGPEPGSTTPRRTVRHPHTQQRDSAGRSGRAGAWRCGRPGWLRRCRTSTARAGGARARRTRTC